jgi:hypothetical protein
MSHCLFAPSAASRWTNCTASILFTKDIPEKTSEYADEGSAAHEWAAWELKLMDIIDDDEAVSKHLALQPVSIYDCDEMRNYVKHYVNYVQNLKKDTVDYGIENQFDIGPIDGFGTVDFYHINSKGVLDIVDLKYGSGVKVSAKDNMQMMLYAHGIIEILCYIADIHIVNMHIVQPRYGKAGNYGVDTKYKHQILDFGKLVSDKRVIALHGGEFKEGPWCWFCRGKSICPELKSKSLLKDFEEDIEYE